MKSFVPVSDNSDFSIHNLPYGVFSTQENPKKRIGIAIGELILDLSEVAKFYSADVQSDLRSDVLNPLMSREKTVWQYVRTTTQNLLLEGSELSNDKELQTIALVPQNKAIMHLPANVGDYTDFFSSSYHAQNCGQMFRGNDALLPNWKYLPVGYHGRSSSLVISGTPIRRPFAQTAKNPNEAQLGPCKWLDFELEMLFYVGGKLNQLGERITAQQATEFIFGFSLMNDWSARDIQAWEYIPLGPFTAKNLGTTISPWIVTTESLMPFLVDNFPQDPEPFPFLRHNKFNFDINLEAAIRPENDVETTVCKTNFKYLYWTPAQQLAHHTQTGCNMRPGDVCGSGTISGNTPDSYGSMLELSWKGTKYIVLANDKKRHFLNDGDEVILRGYSEKNGIRVGFGEARGVILPAIPME